MREQAEAPTAGGGEQQHVSAIAKELFYDVCDLPREQRADFLNTRTAGDPALRAALESLLSAHDLAGAFMAGPTLGTTGIDAPEPNTATDPELRARRVIGP